MSSVSPGIMFPAHSSSYIAAVVHEQHHSVVVPIYFYFGKSIALFLLVLLTNAIPHVG